MSLLNPTATSILENTSSSHLERWCTSSALPQPPAMVQSPSTFLLIGTLLLVLGATLLVSAIVSLASSAIVIIVLSALSTISWILGESSRSLTSSQPLSQHSRTQSIVATSWRIYGIVRDFDRTSSERFGTLSNRLSSEDPPVFSTSGIPSSHSHCRVVESLELSLKLSPQFNGARYLATSFGRLIR